MTTPIDYRLSKFLRKVEWDSPRLAPVQYFHKQQDRLFDFITDEYLHCGKTIEQIAKVTGRKPTTIKTWLNNKDSITFEKACELIYGMKGKFNIEFSFVDYELYQPEEKAYAFG